jgi:SRSO17 transposase
MKKEPTESEAAVDQAQQWASGLNEIAALLSQRFPRAEPRERALTYLRGLLSPVERKNGWQLAEEAGDETPYATQHLLGRARWSADEVRDDLRDYVVAHLSEEAAVLVVDETGFLKKGTKSAGVKRQYSGTAGRVENCQVGVFLVYATSRGRTFLDRELYLPQEWAEDSERRKVAGVPETIKFATKPVLARRMIERALAAGVACQWVTGDTVYGNDWRMRTWLEKQGLSYVLAVPCQYQIFYEGARQWASEVLARLPEKAWQRLSAGAGAKGERLYDWAAIPLGEVDERRRRWLLFRRSLSQPTELAYYVVSAPKVTALAEMARVAGTRWTIEESFETAKGEVGLDHYEVRSWEGWYRHVTLALLAHAYLTVTRSRARTQAGAGQKKKRG